MRPMREAPQDGTWILAFRYYPPDDPADPWEPPAFVIRWDSSQSSWRDERGFRQDIGSRRYSICGWMPLPEGIK